MNDYRKEWNAMLKHSARYPAALDSVQERLKSRIRRRKRRELCSVLSTAAAVFLFVALINVSPAFAKAVMDIPVIGRLAELVRFDKSLSGAIDNDYIQAVALHATDNQTTLYLPYVIADEKNLILFYQLPDELAKAPRQGADTFELNLEQLQDGESGRELDGYSYESVLAGYEDLSESQGLLLQRLSFEDIPLPRHLLLTVSLTQPGRSGIEQAVSRFRFELFLDPFAPAKVHEINRTFTALSQRFTVERLLLYPTVTQIDIRFDSSNDSLIKGFDLSILENGREALSKNNGITASYDDNIMHLYLESNYFNPSKKRQLSIQGIQLIPLAEEYLTIDLNAKTMSPKIDRLRLKSVEMGGSNAYAYLEFENEDTSYLPLSMTYEDSTGNTYPIDSISSTQRDGKGEISFSVTVPPDGIILLQRTLTAPTVLDQPILIDIPPLELQPD